MIKPPDQTCLLCFGVIDQTCTCPATPKPKAKRRVKAKRRAKRPPTAKQLAYWESVRQAYRDHNAECDRRDAADSIPPPPESGVYLTRATG